MRPSSTHPSPALPRRPRRRWRAGAAAAAVTVASVIAVGGPIAIAGADEPYLPQDVNLFHEIDGCELHVGALSEIKIGAEVRVRMTGDDPAVFEQTFVVGYSGIFDESLTYGDEIMAGVGGGNLLTVEVTYEDVLIDDYAATAGFPECDGLVPLTVSLESIGSPPAGTDLEVEVRTGECGNDQNPSAVISASPAGGSVTIWADPGAMCPSARNPFGAVVSYDPDQQTQVEVVVGATVTVRFDFTPAPIDTTTTTEPPGTTSTTSTTAAPTTAVPAQPVRPVSVEVLSADLAATAATPVAASPSFTG